MQAEYIKKRDVTLLQIPQHPGLAEEDSAGGDAEINSYSWVQHCCTRTDSSAHQRPQIVSKQQNENK